MKKPKEMLGCLWRMIRITLIASLAWVLPALAASAARISGQFAVSVRVVRHCRVILPGGELVLSCAGDGAYRILMDGRPIPAGRGTGAVKVTPVVGETPRAAPLSQAHWLTILY